MHSEWEELQSHDIVSIEKEKNGLIRFVSPNEKAQKCCNHNEKMKSYCENCGELICKVCAIQLHAGHKHYEIADTFEREILDCLEPVEKQLEEINEAEINLNKMCDEIAKQQAIANNSIRKTFD